MSHLETLIISDWYFTNILHSKMHYKTQKIIYAIKISCEIPINFKSH